MEILLVVLMFGFLGTIAIRAYFNSAQNFQYLETYKEITGVFRQARSAALTNKTIEAAGPSSDFEVPDAYGIYIDLDTQNLIYFADNGYEEIGTENVYHDFEYNTVEEALDHPDTIIKEFNYGVGGYELEILYPDGSSFAEAGGSPSVVTFFYPTGQFASMRACAPTCDDLENDQVSTVLKFTDPSQDIERYIILVSFTGNIEETNSYQPAAGVEAMGDGFVEINVENNFDVIMLDEPLGDEGGWPPLEMIMGF